MRVDKNTIIETAYELIKEENSDWGFTSDNPKKMANFIDGVTSMTDVLIAKLECNEE